MKNLCPSSILKCLPILLISDLLEQIIIEQRQDASEIPHIKKLIAEGHGPYFSLDDQGVAKFRIDWWFLQVMSLGEKFWMKLITPSCPFTLEATRCIMICITCIVGQK